MLLYWPFMEQYNYFEGVDVNCGATSCTTQQACVSNQTRVHACSALSLCVSNVCVNLGVYGPVLVQVQTEDKPLC